MLFGKCTRPENGGGNRARKMARTATIVSRIRGENRGPCVGATSAEGWIFFSFVQSARHGRKMAFTIIYAPHLHVRDFCWGRSYTQRMEKRADAVPSKLSKCRTVSNVTLNRNKKQKETNKKKRWKENSWVTCGNAKKKCWKKGKALKTEHPIEWKGTESNLSGRNLFVISIEWNNF